MTRRLRPEHAKYATWLLDCDGVVLDSNRIKTDAFRDVALPFGQAAADALVAYHVEHGGVSRYVKLRWLQEVALGQPFDEALQRRLLFEFSERSKALLMQCPITEGCLELLEALRGRASAYVVSGGDQDDLREIFDARGLTRHFAGIYGSPRTKLEILDAMQAGGEARAPAVFVGDSRADHQAAEHAGADFVFVSRYSELADWRAYTAQRPSIVVVPTLAQLLE